MREAMLYEKMSNGRVRCNLCAHRCVIADGSRGICHVRENRGGKLFSLVYGQVIAEHVDPVEKKPLFHFYPGSGAYSIATAGCNFRCPWCQNWEIAHMPRERRIIIGDEKPPERIVDAAIRTRCKSIAYTYTEPTVFFEYTYDISKLAHERGIANVYVTNGYMTEEMLKEFHPLLDAANVDLKAFRDETYRRYMGARLEPVLSSLKLMKQLGIWVEVTTLIVPTVNDDPSELRDIARFIAMELGVDTPWHISRFFPAYKMTTLFPTPIDKLRQAYEIGKEEGLRYVYLGNVPQEENTHCYNCHELLIRRSGYFVARNIVTDSRCPRCGATISGVGLSWA
ncbi:MAG: hypothetical protein GDYSWBUE_000966 [Candidatus Fervidibacterota bacterium]